MGKPRRRHHPRGTRRGRPRGTKRGGCFGGGMGRPNGKYKFSNFFKNIYLNFIYLVQGINKV